MSRELVLEQSQQQLQTFLDELKNGTTNYRTISSLDGQVAQEYAGRCVLELLQNAHDALREAPEGDAHRIAFVLSTGARPTLLVANTGVPFRPSDFEGISRLGQSHKDPNESVGNKGLGFRSVLDVCSSPAIWSTPWNCKGEGFRFRFEPGVRDEIVQAISQLIKQGLSTTAPWGAGRPLVDWSPDQLGRLRERIKDEQFDPAEQAQRYLSPYQFPLPAVDPPPDVARLLDCGYATVVRLELDGGEHGSTDAAAESIADQLADLDGRSMVFLEHLKEVVIEIDEAERRLNREVESLPAQSVDEIRVRSVLVAEGGALRLFLVWTRELGGASDPNGSERIRAATIDLPGRWPELRRVEVGVAIEETETPTPGVFVIFLPTTLGTGCASLLNGPFYGSLNRTSVPLAHPYNELLLQEQADITIDAVRWLLTFEDQKTAARAIVDLVSSTDTIAGSSDRWMDRVRARATERGNCLEAQPLVLCERGWRQPTQVRLLPQFGEEDRLGEARWREFAAYELAVAELDSRRDALTELINGLNGSPSPAPNEWSRTLEDLSTARNSGTLEVDWNDLLTSLVAALPAKLRETPKHVDPLATCQFIPSEDGRVLSAEASTRVFFRPVRVSNEEEDRTSGLPSSLQDRVAFLHPEVRTQEGPKRTNTLVQKFLDGRFAQPFDRRALIREVVVPAIPHQPIGHNTDQAAACREILTWAIKLIGTDELTSVESHLGKLPVPCYGGWFPMARAVFGPGWKELGDDLWLVADALPTSVGEELRASSLVPPDDPRWPPGMEERTDLLERGGVIAGLRLQSPPSTWAPQWEMEGYGVHKLHPEAPPAVPKVDWNSWREDQREAAKPYYDGLHPYELKKLLLLPALHHLENLPADAAQALSRLLLASIPSWSSGWKEVEQWKIKGHEDRKSLDSPLAFLLRDKPWLRDKRDVKKRLADRWLVPDSMLRGQKERFAHLDPLSIDLARRLYEDSTLRSELYTLGLNEYPYEGTKGGPALLDALARAWKAKRVPPARIDIFIGQLRNAWTHLNVDKPLPGQFVIRTGRRTFEVRQAEELVDVFLPDNQERTQSLRNHSKPLLEMNTADAIQHRDRLTAASNIQLASALQEEVTVDNSSIAEVDERSTPIQETELAWLSPVLLALAAHGGPNPAGADTKSWHEAALRLRRARVSWCEYISLRLVHGDEIVARNEPSAVWYAERDLLILARNAHGRYDSLAEATMVILDRRNLLPYLRLVLGALNGIGAPSDDDLKAALERGDVDASLLADIRYRWAGSIIVQVDRLRPVLHLLGTPLDGLETASMGEDRLGEWLQKRLTGWPAEALLREARLSRDDGAMGRAVHKLLGERAQLPAWNEALKAVGYDRVSNRRVRKQAKKQFESVAFLLRCLAAHLARLERHDDLVLELLEQLTRFEEPKAWAEAWWEVPCSAVITHAIENWPLEAFRAYLSDSDLDGPSAMRAKLFNVGVDLTRDPWELAQLNRSALVAMLERVQDLHCAWLESVDCPEELTGTTDALIGALEGDAYLTPWDSQELLARSLRLLGDSAFTERCEGCNTSTEIQEQLKLSPTEVEERRKQRQEEQRRRERAKRTFDVAGQQFEIGADSFDKLWTHFLDLSGPKGPDARNDRTTPLDKVKVETGGVRGAGRGGGTPPNSSPQAREFVGKVGEMHAWRFLRVSFGEEIVTLSAWVSGIRLEVRPPVPGEPHVCSDGLGYDFTFECDGKTWYVEVKATAGDDEQFQLGVSEIEAASRFTGDPKRLWRILRVRRALSAEPIFEWLPNPFEEGFRDHFRLKKASLRVWYRRA